MTLVKLQRRLAYRYKSASGEKTHYKYVINIPQDVIEELGWKDGSELRLLAVRGALTLKPETSS